MSELPKTFDFAEIESRWYKRWEKTGAFRPSRPDAEPYTIVNPPPNVTGSLHIGHALDNTLQDILIRHARLKGKDALWVVGTDHAGIATQMVVERQLEAKQDKRSNYTREQFVDKVWEWKAESGGTITRQLRRLGCSMDWSREQFTMDPHFTKAVVKVFVDLYNQGLIYRDKRLVNWDPKLKTAISDLEVETFEVKGHFWHFRYPLADGVKLDNGADHIVVATTRPETMLADMAVAVNADDPRYKSVIGKEILQPITGRRFKIVADEHADPELGSGAVKITPGHDFNDFEVGKRAGIRPSEMLNMFDAEARVVQTADGLIPDDLVGQDRFEARKLVVERLKASGHLVPHLTKDKDGEPVELDAEPRTIQTPFGDRGGVVIEPWLTDQWYVNAEELAKAPLAAVRSGAIEIVPKSWEKTFFNWMENIQPWCVSRQLWWGHRIPAWYGPDGQVFVAEEETQAIASATEFYKDLLPPGRIIVASASYDVTPEHISIVRDEDVLDTWFSSALWPFATLGWPKGESSPSSDGEGDHPQDGGGVSFAAKVTPPPSATVPLPGGAGEDRSTSRPLYNLPPRTNASTMRAKAMRRAMPPSETALWNVLRDRPGGFKFRRQHPAGDYVLDFFCPAAGLAIEVDGEAHDRGNRPERDTRRDAQIAEWGVETLRIPARDVFQNLDGVVAGIVARAEERVPLHHAPHGPPPQQVGEDLLARHYPNNVLISGFDILFFWDARMAMQGMHFMGEVPWKTLYLHGLVRAADGQKMSKSKGNVVDPLILMDQYGADALRFFMAAMESQGRDIKMDDKRVEGYRNFATKLWNAARFCQANGIGASRSIAAPEATLAVNKWIIGEVVETLAKLDKAFEEYRFDGMADAIYHFTWGTFCDWYLELVKPVLNPPHPKDGEGDHPQDGGGVSFAAKPTPPPASLVPLPGGAGEEQEARPSASSGQAGLVEETKSVAGWVLDQILVMLHPFMPFITEELWEKMGDRGGNLLIHAKWPEPEAEVDVEAKAEIDWLIRLVSEIRTTRTELNVPPGARLPFAAFDQDVSKRERLEQHLPSLNRLARVDLMPAIGGEAQLVVDDMTYVLALGDFIDITAEKARITKTIVAVSKEANSLSARLSNPAFIEKAKPEAVEKARADHAEKAAEVERLAAALARLG